MLLFLASRDRFDWWAVLPISILLSMSLSFVGQAFRSQWRLRSMMRSSRKESFGPNPRHADEPWARAARRGSWFWFSAGYVLSLATLAALLTAIMT